MSEALEATKSSASAELEVLRKVVAAFEPLSPSARARVLLLAILRLCPNAFSNEQLWSLVVQGKEP